MRKRRASSSACIPRVSRRAASASYPGCVRSPGSRSQDLTEEFSLSEDSEIRVYAVGEIVPGRVYDSGWIEDAGTGETVWQMTEANTEHAGGAVSNKRADQVITLRAGTYRLRYTSDRGHAFGDWQAFPPDDVFWGIVVFDATPRQRR